MKKLELTIGIIGMTAIVIATVAWQVYRYKDCKKVGHSKTYCILTIGK